MAVDDIDLGAERVGTETPLEELLRASELTNGSINLTRIHGGKWRVVINHIASGEAHPLGHMIHPLDKWDADPVDGLYKALLEDERLCRDLRRRYAAAAKLGYGTPPVAVAPDSMEDLLG